MNHLEEAEHTVDLMEGSMQPYTDEYRNQAIAHALIAIAEQLEDLVTVIKTHCEIEEE